MALKEREERHAEACRDLYPPAGLRGHDHPGPGRGRRRQLRPPGRGPLPVGRPADRLRAHHAARRLDRGDRDRGLAAHRGGGQHRRGHRGAALGLLGRHLVRHRHLRPRPRHRHRRPGRPRPRRHGGPQPARRRPAADHRQVRQRQLAGADDRALRQPLAARADRVRRQGRQGAARALDRRRRGAASSAASSGRSTSGSIPTGWRPTASRSPPCATPWCGRTPTCRAATSPPATREQTLRTMGRFDRRRRTSTTWSSPRVNGQPVRVRDLGRRRGRHQGAALAGAPERRAHRHPGGAAPVRRQHRRGDRRRSRQALARVERAAPAGRASSRSSATSRATSTPPCTRSTST